MTHSKFEWSASRQVAILVLLGASVFGVLAFRNFSSITVLAAIFLYAAVPLGLILLDSRAHQSVGSRSIWATLPVSMAVAVGLLFSLYGWSLWRSFGLFPNYASHRIEFGGGYHPDSVFNVSIIQGILNTGYPTTGQHLEPFSRYHILSHYVDAGVITLLQVDPWDSYALLFFAKAVALTLALIYFSSQVTRHRGAASFFVVLLIVYPAFTGWGHIIANYPQWFPAIALVLIAAKVFEALNATSLSARSFVWLSVSVAVLAMGKVSLGFGFAVVVGLLLLARFPKDFRVYITGALWAGFFAALYFVMFSFRSDGGAPSDGGFLGHFDRSGTHLTALVLMALVLAVVWRINRSVHAGPGAVVIAASTIVVTGLGATVITSDWDLYYFFMGVFSTAALLTAYTVAEATTPWAMPGNESRRKAAAVSVTAMGVGLFLAFFPVIEKATVSPFTGANELIRIARSANTTTYYWLNQANLDGERLTALGGLRGQRVDDFSAGAPYFSELRDSLNDFEESLGGATESRLLFLSAQQHEALHDSFGQGNIRFTSLAVTAVTGKTLIFGVHDLEISSYGFADYGEDSIQLEAHNATDELLCQFDRPVIRVTDVEALTFELICAKDGLDE